MAFAEDLSVFFSADEFAVAAEVPLGLDSYAGLVIFDANGAVLESFGVQTSGPAALRRSDEITEAVEGAQLDIVHADGTVRYQIRSATQIDDGALTLLALARVGAVL